MTRPSQKIFIPDTLAQWPWARHLNPHYAEVKKESAAWTEGFKAFSSKAQNAFNRCDFNLLASLAYPIATKERCRTGCDLMNLFFVIDEYSDVSGEVEVREQKNVVMSALRDPHIPRPKGEWIGGEVARQFWERAIPHASERSQQRFIDTFDQYLEAVVAQAADRSHSSIRDIQSYLEVRRDTIGAKPSFTILEQDMDIPDEVFEHSVIQDLHLATIDMLCIGNDIVSYNLEQARGDDSHNIVTIVMNELKTDVDGAMDWVVKYHVELETKFFDALGRVPKWGEPIDSWVAEYCDGLGNWVRANDQWSFESERYFGARGVEIMKSRWVTLMPKERTEDIGPQVVNGSIS